LLAWAENPCTNTVTGNRPLAAAARLFSTFGSGVPCAGYSMIVSRVRPGFSGTLPFAGVLRLVSVNVSVRTPTAKGP
jgi:hypothetical protein